MPENSVVIEFQPYGQNSLWFKTSFDKSNSGSKGHHLRHFLIKCQSFSCKPPKKIKNDFDNDGVLEIEKLGEILDKLLKKK